jgi:hypothetical protein
MVRHRLKTFATGHAGLHELDSGVLPARLRSPGAIGAPLELLSNSSRTPLELLSNSSRTPLELLSNSSRTPLELLSNSAAPLIRP